MMLPLYLLAAHLAGDFLLQTRWQANGKFAPKGTIDTIESMLLRTRHVLVYCLCFAPIAFTHADWGIALTFIELLFVVHWLTDRQRFLSTPGEEVVWKLRGLRWQWRDGPDLYDRVPRDLGPWPPPNPWPLAPLAIDQSLHVVQIAVLAGLFLS